MGSDTMILCSLSGMKINQHAICQSMESLLRKPKLFLRILFTLTFKGPNHSEDDDRYLIVGTSNQGRLLIVSYAEREDSIRLISARELTRTEREAYEDG